MPLVGKATVNTSILNEFITETVVNVSKTCAAKALNKIEIDVGSVAGDVIIGGEVKQAAAADLNCDQKSDLAAAIKSDMANTVKQSASSTDNSIITGDVGLYSETTANNNTVNRNLMKTTVNDVADCISEATNDYKVHFGSVGGNFTFTTNIDQDVKAKVSQCIQNTKWVQDISVKINNDIEQSAKNTGTAEELFGEIARILASSATLLIVLAVVGGVVFILYVYIKNRKSGVSGGLVSEWFGKASKAAGAVKDAAKTAVETAVETASTITEEVKQAAA